MARKLAPLSIFGVGPVLVGAGLTIILPGLVLYVLVPGSTAFLPPYPAWRLLGAILCLIGIYFWLASGHAVVHNVPQSRLITTGVYGLTRNPMYASFIVFLLPGLALLLDAWFFLFSAALVGLAFARLIRNEERELEGLFGDGYRAYCRRVPRLLPRWPNR